MSARQQAEAFAATALEVVASNGARYMHVNAQEWSGGDFALFVEPSWIARKLGKPHPGTVDWVYLGKRDGSSRDFKTLDRAYREAKRMADEAHAYLTFTITHAADGWYPRAAS